MPNPKEQLPRIFQANIDRLYRRVMEPGLASLVRHDQLVTGIASTMDEFLDRAAAVVDNHTANEAAKAYALILSASFERQLRILGRHWFDEPERSKIATRSFHLLLPEIAEKLLVDLKVDGIGGGLMENFLVANVVRHGDGPACDTLRGRVPRLWEQDEIEYVDLLAGPSPHSELLLIRPADLARYANATIQFWGRADHQPMADHAPHY